MKKQLLFVSMMFLIGWAIAYTFTYNGHFNTQWQHTNRLKTCLLENAILYEQRSATLFIQEDALEDATDLCLPDS
ncbi:hypothetical protein JOC54_004334 [Alkalihalobacillus xiaoxiensis]|uniref:Uncharacterized protein n=1 Tax=Shouchella xiaoxiensis TaxID=766895 RepID=A0ABS2T203_9BACI|nr:hypothetical protein [Shouchella xiaoxiensis]MBM7841035.1 hypothetical protein [Shouchella xiaoxiensis]